MPGGVGEAPAATVRDGVVDLMRRFGASVLFGNPGSTELPLLRNFPRDFSLYLRRSFASSMGLSRQMLDRPIVGIANSASGFNNCHRHFPELIEAVKRGVLAVPITAQVPDVVASRRSI